MSHKVLILLLILLLSSGLSLVSQPVIIKPSTETITREGKPFFIHTVEKGHTLFSISRAYEVAVEDITINNPGAELSLSIGQKLYIPALKPAKPTPYSPSASEPVAPTDGEKIIFHVVRKGETTYGISKIYDITVESIVRINPSAEKGISEGERLRIPLPVLQVEPVKPKTHTINYQVKRDENLLEIATTFGITVEDILNANPNLDLGIGRLKKGTELRIPQPAETTVTAKDSLIESKKNGSEGIKPARLKPCSGEADPHQKYRVALLLPLYSRSVEGIPTDPITAKPVEEQPSFRFIQFLEGSILALDTLRDMGMNAELFVFDVDEDTNTAIRLLREQSLQGMDLIIGPLFSAPFSIISEYAQRKRIPIVNPLSQRDEIVEGNPYVFKIIPSPLDRMKSVASFALDKYPHANLHIIHRPVDREIKAADSFVTVVNQVFTEYQRDSGDYHLLSSNYASVSKLRSAFTRDRMNVIFTLSSDQVFVLNFLRNLGPAAQEFPFLIFGLPSWPEFTGMEPQYLLDQNIHMYANSWVDYSSMDVKRFVLGFREQYSAEPDHYAFRGYDITRYFLTALLRYGREFPNCLYQLELPGLQSNFRFVQSDGHGYVNTYTRIFRYQDYREVDARMNPVLWP